MLGEWFHISTVIQEHMANEMGLWLHTNLSYIVAI